MGHMRDILRTAFSFHGDTAEPEVIRERILSGGEIHGTNLCVLMLAIFIASIGLNMNSTAVIIGAMLISPLMGTIMAMAYGIVTLDWRQASDSAMGLFFQVVICLVTSMLYFMVSPITTASSEILARTSPTIWDVLIAFFGGFAGIIGFTRKEKSNIIPGVAIATALMPPLCTAGYGLAVHSWQYFAGAMYLFLINTYFIALATGIGLIIMKVPQRKKMRPEIARKLKRNLVRNTILFILPSIFLGGRLVRQEMQDTTPIYESKEAKIDLKHLQREVKLVYPSVTDVRVGYIYHWDDQANKQIESLDMIVKSKTELPEEKKEIISKWLKLETNYDEITFIVK
ncbi:MAG: TIGR00341 family protein [Lachnospiraceae bacterium]